MNWIQIDKQDNESLYRLAIDYPGFRPYVIDHIRDDEWIFRWAFVIGDRDIMRERITDMKWICEWMSVLGDWNIMRKKITLARRKMLYSYPNE